MKYIFVTSAIFALLFPCIANASSSLIKHHRHIKAYHTRLSGPGGNAFITLTIYKNRTIRGATQVENPPTFPATELYTNRSFNGRIVGKIRRINNRVIVTLKMASPEGDIIQGTAEFARVGFTNDEGVTTYSTVKTFKGRISEPHLIGLTTPHFYISGLGYLVGPEKAL